MDIKTCRTCGKIFQFRGNYQCQECVRAADEKFVTVRNYMFDNPSANMQEICDTCDVDEEVVLRWIREGRLIVHEDGAPLLKCMSCGRAIHAGRYCLDCSRNVESQINSAARDIQRGIDEMHDRKGYHNSGLRRK